VEVMTNLNGDSCDIYHNLIDENPLFVDTLALNFNLQGASPCIDAGDPVLPHDPDNTFADMGALYYNQAGVLPLDVTLIPLNPPIVVPAQGGSFSFNVNIQRVIGPVAPYTVWARLKNPNGTYTAPTLGPVTINTPVGLTVTRTRNQNVPNTWAAGLYTYLGYANNSFAYPAVDSSSFTWTKSAAVNGGPTVWDAVCSGELFPGEVTVSAPIAFTIMVAHPNPFNPATTISFTLPQATKVALNVYDITGRQVAALVNGWTEAGSHEIIFQASQLSSGVYLAHLNLNNCTQIQKLLLVK
jgi:hypothetical protein